MLAALELLAALLELALEALEAAPPWPPPGPVLAAELLAGLLLCSALVGPGPMPPLTHVPTPRSGIATQWPVEPQSLSAQQNFAQTPRVQVNPALHWTGAAQPSHSLAVFVPP